MAAGHWLQDTASVTTHLSAIHSRAPCPPPSEPQHQRICNRVTAPHLMRHMAPASPQLLLLVRTLAPRSLAPLHPGPMRFAHGCQG